MSQPAKPQTGAGLPSARDRAPFRPPAGRGCSPASSQAAGRASSSSPCSQTFRPIGEEFLYRGIAQESFASKLGTTSAALLDAAAFAVVHLAHFGVVYVVGGWAFLLGPAALWLAAMFASSLVFHSFRRLSGSILGAVTSHAAFNLVMTFVIFYALDLF